MVKELRWSAPASARIVRGDSAAIRAATQQERTHEDGVAPVDMKAGDIMTTDVIMVAPDTTVREIAMILLERRISGLPVVENDRVVGIVSEGDLLRRHEIGTERKVPHGSWWMRLFHGEAGPSEYVRSHAVYAADVMTREVISRSEGEPVAAIASLFCERAIKRVPILRGGRLVGIVTRANLVQALAARNSETKGERALDDVGIRSRLLQELAEQPWWRAESNVHVVDGVVHYFGLCENEAEKQAARVAAENVPGVRRVDDHRVRYAELPFTIG
jgi:CBS domain-containing protein